MHCPYILCLTKSCIESGTRSSLHPFYKHQITFCTINDLIPPAPFYRRKVWQYNKADAGLLKNAMLNLTWANTLNSNTNPNWQVETINTILLNIMFNFIPNKTLKIEPKLNKKTTGDMGT